MDHLNSDKVCPLKVAWILEDINLISESFPSISFLSVPFKCNRAALALTSYAKEKEEVFS